MKLSRLLQIIKEEVENWFDDDDQSMLNAYNDKFMSTQAPPQPTAPTQAPQVQMDGELIGYVTKEWSKTLPVPIPIYKNPKSLNGVGVEARGALLSNGDFYLTPSANAMHDNILTVLGEKGIIPYARVYHYYEGYPEEFVAVLRVAKTNTFAQSAAYDEFPEHYQEIFKIGEQKHPFQFRAFNLNEIESPLDPNYMTSNAPAGNVPDRMYESMNFLIKDYDYDQPNNIMKMGFIIQREVLNDIFRNKMTPEQREKFYNERALEIFAPDGNSAFEQKGILNFYINGIPEEFINEILNGIKTILPKYGVKLLGIKREKSNTFNSEVIRLSLDIPKINVAPEMNVANGNAATLLEFLGYDIEQGDMGSINFQTELPIRELLSRIAIAEDKLTRAFDMPDTGRTVNPEPEYGKPIQTNIYLRELGKNDLKRYLERLKGMAKYAQEKGYDTISIG